MKIKVGISSGLLDNNIYFDGGYIQLIEMTNWHKC
jgi:hypothetical protein